MRNLAILAVAFLAACSGGGGGSAPAHVDYQIADLLGTWEGDGVSRDHGAFHCRLAVSDDFGGSAEFATYGYGDEEIGFSAMASVVDGDTLDIVFMRARIVSTSLMVVDSDILTGDHLRITLTR